MYRSPKAYSYNSNRHNGAALIEFAIVLPFLILVFAGLVEIGSFINQILEVSTAVRHGARSGVLFGKDLLPGGNPQSCEYIKQKAWTEGLSDLLSNLPSPKNRWIIENTDVSIITSSDMSVNPSVSLIRVKGKAIGTRNCVFCYSNFLAQMLPEVAVVFMLEQPCAP